MANKRIYLLFVLAFALQACNFKKQTNWRITLDHEDKKPYGAYLAYQSLKYYFPGVKTEIMSRGFRYNNIDYKMKYDVMGASLLVLAGLDFYIADKELNELLEFAREGNEVVLFSSTMDFKLEEKLKVQKQVSTYEERPLSESYSGKENRDAISVIPDTSKKYGYTGRSLQGYYELDTSVVTSDETTLTDENNVFIALSPHTLGLLRKSPNFLRYKVGTGHISIHAAPLVLSNYFLLQKNNHNYLSGIWSTLPDNITHVYWNSYYKRNAQQSDFSVLWRYPATRWALILALITLGLYILFESKRRQRIIPIIKPLENSSVSFVETVGRLYYNKGNHTTLQRK